MLVTVMVFVATAVALPTSVDAHASPVRSDPAPDSAVRVPPTRVTIWFSEPLTLPLSRIEVRDTSNARVDNADTTGDPSDPTRLSVGIKPLPAGTYTVIWNNVSTLDGHPLRGSFVFYVGEKPEGATAESATRPPMLASPIDPWIRWIALLAALGATGSLLFEGAVLRPAIQSSPSRAPVRLAAATASEMLARWRMLATYAFLVASVLQLFVQASVVAGVDVWSLGLSGVTDVVQFTGWGRNWLVRVTLALVAVVAPIVATRVVTGPGRARGLLTDAVPFAAMLGALATYSLSSHGAASTSLAFPGATTDYVHLVAAAVWVGGLFALLPTLMVLRRAVQPADRRPLLVAVAERFTTLASLSLAVLLLTGVYASWLQVTTFEALGTPYGVTLVVKVALVALLALLGGLNLLRVRPTLARAERAASGAAWFERLVLAEVVLAVLVVLSVGLLTSMEPARQVHDRESGGGIRAVHEAAGTTVALQVQPGASGTNRILLTITDRRGDRVTDATSVVVRVRYLDVDLGVTEANATLTEDGRYEVPRVPISIAGMWEVQASVSRPGAADATIASRFTIGAAAPSGTAGPPPETGRTLWSWLVLGVGMAILVLAPRAWSGRIARTRVRIGATTMVLTGVILVYGAHSHTGPSQQAVNPIPANTQSIDAGRELYQKECVSCHGPAGFGDGPQAKTLNPPPADLRAHVPLHGDGQIFAFISGGFPGSAMPAFSGRLTDTQMWNLVNYLRSLTQTTTQ